MTQAQEERRDEALKEIMKYEQKGDYHGALMISQAHNITLHPVQRRKGFRRR